MKPRTIFDISLPIFEGMIVYPKNPKVYLNSYRKMPKDSSNITKITFGSHAGTHIDAPSHVFPGAKSVDAFKLERFMGPCRVLDMTHVKESVGLENVKKENIKQGQRILMKTKNSLRGYKKFYNNFIYLEGDAAEFLAKKNIVLFGIDYLSIKKKGSKDNRSHTMLLKKGIPIVEGLDLSRIKPGVYQLVVLPLAFKGIDGAPARAILIT